ncbi:MAG: hypothetical protein K6G47_05995 [Clostridia bacterium]|nr:hypothetical protein [Clostridia bacterium]
MLLELHSNCWSEGILTHFWDFKTSNLEVVLDEDNGGKPGRYKLTFNWKLYQYSGFGIIYFSGDNLILCSEFGNNYSRLDMKEGFRTPGYLGGEYCALYDDEGLNTVFQLVLNDNRENIKGLIK